MNFIFISVNNISIVINLVLVAMNHIMAINSVLIYKNNIPMNAKYILFILNIFIFMDFLN